MPMGRTPTGTPVDVARRYERESVEFARLVNLSDAVFAIAMTLLVLGLAVPDVPADAVGRELVGVVPHLVAFLLSFALVANLWWQHHKLFALLGALEPGTIGINLALLAAVALVPFPASLLGRYPTSSAVVVPFILVFAVLVALFIAQVRHAQRRGAWSRPMPDATYPWVVAGFAVVLAVMLLAAAIAVRWPIGGLVVLTLSSVPELVLARWAPADYRAWS
jgi:uncharacterized membrane protein